MRPMGNLRASIARHVRWKRGPAGGTDDKAARLLRRMQAGSGNVRRIDIILVLLWLMTFEALFDDIRHDWLLGISLRPKLKTPTTRRRIFFRILHHYGQTLQGTLHVRAVDYRKLMQVG